MFSSAFVHLFTTENLKESGMEERGEEKGRESAEWKGMKGGRRDSIGYVNPCDFLKTVFCLLEWRANDESLRFVYLCQY